MPNFYNDDYDHDHDFFLGASPPRTSREREDVWAKVRDYHRPQEYYFPSVSDTFFMFTKVRSRPPVPSLPLPLGRLNSCEATLNLL